MCIFTERKKLSQTDFTNYVSRTDLIHRHAQKTGITQFLANTGQQYLIFWFGGVVFDNNQNHNNVQVKMTTDDLESVVIS